MRWKIKLKIYVIIKKTQSLYYVKNKNFKIIVFQKMEILKSNKGNIKIAYEGSLYTKKKNCKKHIQWKCSKASSLKCFANFTTSLDLNSPKLIRDHCHLPNENLVIVEKIKSNMKEQAKMSSKLPGQIFSEIVLNQLKEVLYQLSSENSIKQTLRNQRNENHPNDGNCEDLKNLKIEGELYNFLN